MVKKTSKSVGVKNVEDLIRTFYFSWLCLICMLGIFESLLFHSMLFLCQTDRINLVHVPYNLIHLNEAYFYFILHTWLCSTLQKCLTIKIDIFCTWYIISSEINTVYQYELEALTRGHIVCFERKLNLELYFKIYDSSFMFFLHYTNHTDWVIWIFCNKYW